MIVDISFIFFLSDNVEDALCLKCCPAFQVYYNPITYYVWQFSSPHIFQSRLTIKHNRFRLYITSNSSSAMSPIFISDNFVGSMRNLKRPIISEIVSGNHAMYRRVPCAKERYSNEGISLIRPSSVEVTKFLGLWCGHTPSLTHWGRVTHICVGNLTIIGPDNGLSPGRRQAIIWTNAEMLLFGPWGTNFGEISIGIQLFSFNKMHLTMSAKWRPFFSRPQCVKKHISVVQYSSREFSIESQWSLTWNGDFWCCTGPLLYPSWIMVA